jgi:ferredoxin
MVYGCYALDCRRQSGAEERGFAESEGAHGSRRPRTSLLLPTTGHHWPGCLGCGSCWDRCAMASVGSSTVAMIRIFSMMIVCSEDRASARPTILAYGPSQPRY